MSRIARRKLVIAGMTSIAGVAGIETATRIAGEHGLLPPDSRGLYGCGHTLTYAAHRLLAGNAHAREFARGQISRTPHPKGDLPKGGEFARLQADGFESWQLKVDGLVKRPGAFSMAELKSFPRSSQITQLICEEGWSYIAEWTGVPLAHLLNLSGIRPQARYVVYYSMDGWVDAIDMNDAWHPQTLVSYGMNSGVVPVGHGGPLRLRVPRQLGYKSLKFLNRVSITDTLQGVPLDHEYSWYAGI